ncbi:MAG: PAS domain-containing protein, partial [Gemmatimonadetes bacterium]|nr:PAS domain-containing protein [Gemmatimonadota bacterium]NIQ55844.1 PAS domain-containing protein [Gemmatimonadota bacterium]NIU76046.1 PAS domain-containing protein [Gammaproteobacteria bacterium]NIX45616.1 PAS domain-containing protein [Gemmatimonadota bacterium]NIY09906.1 PAS domain-containing protein [Gemmatimonadota bacterium]
RTPTAAFLYAQALFDVLLVTAVVHMTGRAESEFVPLYVLVITEGALLLPLRGGLLMGTLATFLYFADVVWGPALTEALGGAPPPTELDAAVLVRVALFLVIAGATAWLGDRLRRTGSELGAVASELRQLRLDTSDILGTLDTGVVTVDSEGGLVYMNRSAERLLGMRSEDWVGRPERGALEQLGRVAPGISAVVNRTLTTGRPVERYETHSRASPEPRILGVRSTPLERDGSPWVTVVLQDITDALRVEALHRRAERLEAVAELSASLAHEIKNPLASIRSAVEQLTRPEDRLERTDRGVLGKLVLAESDRLSRLLSGFIEFSRVELQERATVDLEKVVDGAIEMVRQHPDSLDGPGVEVDARPVEVEGDRDLLHQVVFNLVLNAVQHTDPDAPVRVELGAVPPGGVPVGVDLDGAARLRVTDRGPGIR